MLTSLDGYSYYRKYSGQNYQLKKKLNLIFEKDIELA
jgi:hypothetical protein